MIKNNTTNQISPRLVTLKHFKELTESRISLSNATFPATRCNLAAFPHGPARFPKPNDWKQLKANRITGIALSYMLANLDKPIRVATLCTLAGASSSQFHYLFKQVTGFTPNDFLIHLRIGHGCFLLAETNLRVKEVAATLGYYDPFYFSRMFKSVSGISPSQYRKTQAKTSN